MGAALMLLAALFISGCTETPSAAVVPTSTQTPLPTLALKTVKPDPTPTLDNSAPTRALPTPLITRSIVGQTQASAGSATPAPSGPTLTPSATPEIDERLQIGERAFEVGDYGLAAEQFGQALRQEPALEGDEQADALQNLGRSYLADERFMDAATIFNQLIALQGADEVPAETHFLLGQAYFGQDEFEDAVEAYETFLTKEPAMAGYVSLRIAEAYRALGDDAAVLAAYESAAEAPAYLVKEVQTRFLLADAYLGAGEYDLAIEQCDIIHDMAKTEATRGQVTFQAGAAELTSGDTEAAYERFLKGVNDYPGAYESYLGLVELVKAEVPVDDYQRGLVDFNAAAYAPGIEAFQAYIEASPEDFKPDAHLYLAWSHEALGDLESAFSELENYAEFEAADGLMEEAKMRARSGDAVSAVDLYQQYVDAYPDSEDAPFAAWQLATLAAELGDTESASEHFVWIADSFAEHEDAPEALYRAGQLAAANEDMETAVGLWMRAAEQYPANLFGSAALLDILLAESETGNGDSARSAAALAASPGNSTYQAVRARDLSEGKAPFDSSVPLSLPQDDSQEQETAESWLVEQFELDPDALNGEIVEELQQDERLVIGKRLWELGMYEEAKRELESLRQTYAEDPLATYQLALFFRDLGLYRSSIIAASTLLYLAGTHELDAPVYIGRLSYPTYYADLIVPLSEQNGFDPLLQFSLVRQESLYESFARSGAAAQGLSQVIPDTGAWIAERLQWPEYENDDLYKPYVGLNFGAYYLGQQLEYFDGDVHAALAAYNAGPGNAARWYETAGSDLDLFVDTIDFNETKTYVERIYAGYDIYSQLYGPQ